MGRHLKSILTTDGMDRRDAGYYSTPQFVADFLSTAMLEINSEGQYVLDPAVGKEELLDRFHEAGKTIEGFDIQDFGLHEKASFTRKDFLEFYTLEHNCSLLGTGASLKYDYYIANPPYNCHESEYIRGNKNALLAAFPQTGVNNMYSMFIAAMIDLAKPGALIGLITLDSFLTAKMHQSLRTRILERCSVHYIVLCPTDLFWNQKADVRTCLLILQKGKQYQGRVKVANRSVNTQEFKNVLMKREFEQVSINQLILDHSCDNGEFVIGVSKSIKDLFSNPRLGDVFRCVTGISTGADARYISKERTNYFSVPFYKNPGSRRFYMEPDGYLPQDFLQIEKRVPNFMVRNKDILFLPGISCSSMGIPFTACYLPANATFGVNPNIICGENDLWWLLAYLNSSLVTYFVRGILIRTNMITSGYASRIPIVPLSMGQKRELGRLANKAFAERTANGKNVELIEAIDSVVTAELSLPKNELNRIKKFCNSLLRST